jgi:hypothetical protein
MKTMRLYHIISTCDMSWQEACDCASPAISNKQFSIYKKEKEKKSRPLNTILDTSIYYGF